MRKKLILWLSTIITLVISGYAALSFVFYAWLSASDPVNWPQESTELWAYSSLTISIVFLGLFIYSIYKIVKTYKTVS